MNTARRILLAGAFIAAFVPESDAQSFQYDTAGRLIEARYDATNMVSYGYDPTDNLTNLTVGASFGETDTDADAMADAWELVWFNNLTNAAAGDFNSDTISNLKHFQDGTDPTDPDTDGDGMGNTDEILAGTQPTNALSVLKVSSLQHQAPFPVVSWQSATGKHYRIQRATNLVSGFSSIQSNIPATPAINVFTDSIPPSAGSGFYRVQLE